MAEKSEYLTRKEKIDPLLFEQGWDVSDHSCVRVAKAFTRELIA